MRFIGKSSLPVKGKHRHGKHRFITLYVSVWYFEQNVCVIMKVATLHEASASLLASLSFVEDVGCHFS